MPRTDVLIYRDDDGTVPVLAWLDGLPPKAQDKCRNRTRTRRRKVTRKRKPTTDAVDIIERRYYEGRPERRAELAEARANDAVARKICELRTKAGLTQRQLAKLVGTSASV